MTRVLVVDDSSAFRGVACAWVDARPGLELAGSAKNGLEAIAAVDRSHPDLVLMDALMPEMDGFEATRLIKAGPDAPLIAVLTLHDSSAMRRAAELAGADGFVAKGQFTETLPGLLETFAEGRKRKKKEEK
jgi:CheY-like chemotaxis protein